MITKLKYTHLPLGEDVEAFAGYYTPEKEATLEYNGRKVLYVTGHVVIEATCAEGGCTTANYWYAIVPGYLLQWQNETNQDSLPVSEVEPIDDEKTRNEIKEIILNRESVFKVDFWYR